MEISQIYGHFVAEHFDKDPFGIYAESRDIVLQQVRQHLPAGAAPGVLDLGMGTGELLLALGRIYPQAALKGIEISEGMLGVAKKKLEDAGRSGAQLYHDGAQNLVHHIPAQSIDLMTGHYVWNYLDPASMIPDILRSLKPGGLLSVASSTHECFSTLHALAKNFVSAEFIQEQLFLPSGLSAWNRVLKASGFQIVEEKLFDKKFAFQDFDELRSFALHSGWLAHPFFAKLSEEELAVYRELFKNLFPMEENFQASILLAQKS